MTDNPLEQAVSRVLNDRRIFEPPYDRESKARLPLLFTPEQWQELRASFLEGDENRFRSLVDQRMSQLGHTGGRTSQWEEGRVEEFSRLGNALKVAVTRAPHVLNKLFNTFEAFGLLQCNLPNMEDFGRVIEGHGRATAEQFFLHKIDKEKDRRRRKALIAVLEVVTGLYDQRVEPLEIAFFVRKIDSLAQLAEVLK